MREKKSYFRSSATRLRKKDEKTKGKMRSLGWLMAFKCLHVYKCESILERDRYEHMTSVQREWVRVKEVGIVP